MRAIPAKHSIPIFCKYIIHYQIAKINKKLMNFLYTLHAILDIPCGKDAKIAVFLSAKL